MANLANTFRIPASWHESQPAWVFGPLPAPGIAFLFPSIKYNKSQKTAFI